METRIALALMQFGKWDLKSEAETLDGRLDVIHYVFGPPEGVPLNEGEEFEMARTLSSIYSSLFNLATLRDDGSVDRLTHEPTPGGLGKLVPADYFENPDRVLGLWCFNQQPRSAGNAE